MLKELPKQLKGVVVEGITPFPASEVELAVFVMHLLSTPDK